MALVAGGAAARAGTFSPFSFFYSVRYDRYDGGYDKSRNYYRRNHFKSPHIFKRITFLYGLNNRYASAITVVTIF